MNSLLLRIIGLATTALASATLANAASVAGGSSTLDWNAIHKSRTQVQASSVRAQAHAKKLNTHGASGTTKPSEKFANVDRAYPPSCLQSPLALGMYNNDPYALTAQITLFGDPLAGDPDEQSYYETDMVTLFRVVCSDGTSATLLEIDRPPANEGNTTRYPTLPGISVAQGSKNIFVRMSNDPNTFFAASFSLTPLVNSDLFVLENFYGGPVQLDYNQPFVLTVDNFSTSGNRYTNYSMPAYNPAAYAEASLPLPINGYMSTVWTNPNQSGEGIFVQVYDAGDQTNRILAFSWFTYDDLGLPFWLYGQVTFPIGARTVNVPTIYLHNGTFSPPNLSPSTTRETWGTVTLSFPDCANMNLIYNGDASAINGPKGSGNETFLRVANVNSLVCQ